MRQIALTLDAFYRRNFTDLIDTVGHYQIDVAEGGVRFYWVPTFEGFLGNLKGDKGGESAGTSPAVDQTETEQQEISPDFEKVELDIKNSDFIILSPFIMHKLVVPNIPDMEASRLTTNTTLETLIESSWPNLLQKLETNYPDTTFLIINNEDSKILSSVNDDGCYYCQYWSDRINKVFNDFYESRLIPIVDDEGVHKKVYRSNVHVFSASVNSVYHPFYNEGGSRNRPVLGDKYHLMTRDVAVCSNFFEEYA